MREGWEIKTLGEVCDISAGQGAPQGEDNYCLDGTPFIKAGNLEALVNGEREQSVQKVSKEVALSHHLVLQKKGSIVFAKSGMSCMKGYVYTLQQDCYVVSHLAILFPKSVSGQYLNYALHFFKPSSLAKDASFPSITLKDLAIFPIPFPTSLQEQLRIVDILDREFAKIDALKANAEKSFQAAKDLFQATLKKELEPKEGWQRKRLEEICQITAELINPTLPEYINQIHIGGANIVAETGVLIGLKTSREENLISGKFPFDETMVLYSKIRPYLKKVCCPDFQGICSADIYPLKPNQDVDRTFLYYILLSQDFTDYAILGSARAGMPKVNRPYMFAYTCSIPEYEEQRKIANRLDAVREQTNALQDNYQKTLALCDDLKQVLLRKAFNGEL
ncbi:MAG: restriction endonuclease subunit S [Bacteroidales bacterium]|nr:restriction endonuclease subunit S [Bacteroidales bacterium]